MQRKPYDKPTHIAQTEEPWSHLHDMATLASTRRSVMHYEHQVTSRGACFSPSLRKPEKIYQSNLSFPAAPYCSFLNTRLQRTALISNLSLSTITTRTTSGQRTRFHTRRRPPLRATGVRLCGLTVHRWNYRTLIEARWFTIFHIHLQDTGKVKAGNGKGTRERHQNVGRSTEALHLQHEVKHRWGYVFYTLWSLL